MSDSDMAKRIKELRLSLNLTLEEVANQVGVGKSTVRKWETGMIANMKRDKIAALAKALHTTPTYLMGWSDEPSLPPISKRIREQIENEFGKNAATALKLYVQLDEIDQGKIIERMETLLEDEKYSSNSVLLAARGGKIKLDKKTAEALAKSANEAPNSSQDKDMF